MNTLLNFRTIKNIFLLILVIAPLVFKMMYLDSILYSLTRTKFFVAAQVFANDAIIYSTIIILFYLSYLIKTTYIISIILRGLAFLVLSLYVVDLLVITNFNTHLVITDAIKYASYSLVKSLFELTQPLIDNVTSVPPIISNNVRIIFLKHIVFPFI